MSVPRDTHSYTKVIPQTRRKVFGRCQKATRVSEDSDNSPVVRMNAERGRALFLGALPDLQSA